MQRKSKVLIAIVSLICILIGTIMAAVPLFNEATDAKLLTVIAGSMGVGVLLTRMVCDLKS